MHPWTLIFIPKKPGRYTLTTHRGTVFILVCSGHLSGSLQAPPDTLSYNLSFTQEEKGKREHRGVMLPNTVQGGRVGTLTATQGCNRMVGLQQTFVFSHMVLISQQWTCTIYIVWRDIKLLSLEGLSPLGKGVTRTISSQLDMNSVILAVGELWYTETPLKNTNK